MDADDSTAWPSMALGVQHPEAYGKLNIISDSANTSASGLGVPARQSVRRDCGPFIGASARLGATRFGAPGHDSST